MDARFALILRHLLYINRPFARVIASYSVRRARAAGVIRSSASLSSSRPTSDADWYPLRVQRRNTAWSSETRKQLRDCATNCAPDAVQPASISAPCRKVWCLHNEPCSLATSHLARSRTVHPCAWCLQRAGRAHRGRRHRGRAGPAGVSAARAAASRDAPADGGCRPRGAGYGAT